MGIRPRRCLSVATGGSTSVSLLLYAQSAIRAGEIDNVVIVAADNLATGLGTDAAVESFAAIGHPQYEAPYGVMIPALYALFAMRYLVELGVAPEEVAQAAVTDRYHASLNPAAQYRDPIGVDDVLGSRMVADPLHLLECAPVSDAGSAVVLGGDGRIAAAPNGSVRILGIGEAHQHEHIIEADSLVATAASISGERAFAAAGVSRADIDVAMIYDAFAFIQCMQLEDLGFCDKGEGGAFVASGATRVGGALPTNTHGGVLSHSHAGKPSGLNMVIEATRQLRGECGDRQVAGAEVALVHTEGGLLASHATAVLAKGEED
jgi:acetyl-CoA acetyltransferase